MAGKRDENIDCLRIVAMFFVVCVHYVGWGGIAGNAQGIINFSISGIIAVACNCAVNCFYLISGYMITGEERVQQTKRRVLKAWMPTLFYSVSIPVLLQAFGGIRLSIKQNLMLFLPFLSNQYWFSTCFIAMAMLLPFMGRLLRTLDKRELLVLVVSMLVLDAVQPILGINAFGNIGYGVLHAATMYLIGYYLKRYPIRLKQWMWAAVFIASVGLIGVVTLVTMKLTGDRNRTIADYNSLIMIVQSIAFFSFMTALHLPDWHFSKVAPYIFGVYLLNDNPYAREFLWQRIFRCSDFYGSNLMVIHLLLSCAGFMVCAMLIEWIRINVVRRIKQMWR